MKKILTILLSVLMVSTMTGVNVFAQEATPSTSGSTTYDNNTDGEGRADSASGFNTTGDNTTTVDEYYSLTKSAGTDDGTLDYYVVVSWTRTNGTATAKGDTYHWDASKQMYERTTQENELTSNTPATVEFTVTNYSNAKVNYEVTYANNDTAGYSTTEAASAKSEGSAETYSKTGTLANYITYQQADGSTIANEGIENVEADGNETKVTTTGEESYSHVHTAPTETYKGSVTLNANGMAKSAFTDQVVGTYTINITAAPVTKETVAKTVVADTDTILTAQPNPADNNAETTTVTIPSTVAALTAGSTASLTVDATPILDANQTSSFNIGTVGAVGAIDLTLKVTKTDSETGVSTTETVSEFKNSAGESVPVKVTTYTAKGLTNVALYYTPESGSDETWATPVDSADAVTTTGQYYYNTDTGELVFMTTHFSVYRIGANEKAYIESEHKAYSTLEAAYTAVEAGDTISLLKDDTLTASGNAGYAITKAFTLDLCGKTLTGGIRTGDIHAYSSLVNMTITDSVGGGKFEKDSNALYNVYLWAPGMTINGGTFTSNVQRSMICQQYLTSDEALRNSPLTINGGTFTNSHIYGSVLYNACGKTVVNGGTFTAGKYGSLISVNSETDDATVVINGGTFTGACVFDIYAKSGHKATVNVYGGTFYYMDPSTGKAATNMDNFVCDNNMTTKGTDYDVVIYGGTFNVNPSNYVASGCTATYNESAGTWTVSEQNAG